MNGMRGSPQSSWYSAETCRYFNSCGCRYRGHCRFKHEPHDSSVNGLVLKCLSELKSAINTLQPYDFKNFEQRLQSHEERMMDAMNALLEKLKKEISASSMRDNKKSKKHAAVQIEEAALNLSQLNAARYELDEVRKVLEEKEIENESVKEELKKQSNANFELQKQCDATLHRLSEMEKTKEQSKIAHDEHQKLKQKYAEMQRQMNEISNANFALKKNEKAALQQLKEEKNEHHTLKKKSAESQRQMNEWKKKFEAASKQQQQMKEKLQSISNANFALETAKEKLKEELEKISNANFALKKKSDAASKQQESLKLKLSEMKKQRQQKQHCKKCKAASKQQQQQQQKLEQATLQIAEMKQQQQQQSEKHEAELKQLQQQHVRYRDEMDAASKQHQQQTESVAVQTSDDRQMNAKIASTESAAFWQQLQLQYEPDPVFQFDDVCVWQWDERDHEWQSHGKGDLSIYQALDPKSDGIKIVFVDVQHSKIRLLQCIDPCAEKTEAFIDAKCAKQGIIIEWVAADHSLQSSKQLTARWRMLLDHRTRMDDLGQILHIDFVAWDRELAAFRKVKRANDICHRCKKKGHWASDCDIKQWVD